MHAAHCVFAGAYALDPTGLTARAMAMRNTMDALAQGEGVEADRASCVVEFIDRAMAKLSA